MPLNDPNTQSQFIVTILMLKEVILGLLGGAVAYLFDYSKASRKGEEFSFRVGALLVNMALGAFVSYIVGTVIPIDTTGRDAIIGISGVTAYQILLITESKFAGWLFDRLTNKKD